MTEQIGLEAVMDDKQFQKAIDGYLSKIADAVQGTEKAASQMSTDMLDMLNLQQDSLDELGGIGMNLEDILGGGAEGMAALGAEGGIMAGVMAGVVTAGIGLVVDILGKMLTKVKEVIAGMIEFTKQAILVSARVDELEIVAGTIGATFGYTREQISAATQDVIDYGIQSDVANNFVIAAVRNQLDLAKSMDIARVAQDAAVISMSDSSETLDRFIWGIETLNTRVLKTAGVTINANTAYKTYGEQIGKTADQLTAVEKKQAFVNAILQEGTRIAGAYEAAMTSPSKRLRSLERILFEIKNALGAPFQDAFLQFVILLENVAKGIQNLLTEGDFLGWLRKVGAFLAVALEGLNAFVSAVMPGITNVTNSIGRFFSWLGDMAAKAFTWGVNLITQFARGIIEAGTRVIVGAMNFISGMLRRFLSPGSPPKVAPQIDIWGKKTFEEYLKGFTKADFGVLKDVQSELSKVFGALEAKGLGKEASAKAQLKINQQLAAAMDTIAAGGDVDASLFNFIEKKLGMFGDEVSDLVRLELELAKAVNKVETAEKKLDKARDKRVKGQQDLVKLVSERNKLIARGASGKELKANLDLIKAQQRAGMLDEQAEIAADAELTAAEKQAEMMKEQIDLQKELIDQLTKFVNLQAQAVATPPEVPAAAGGGGVGGLLPEEGELIEPIDFTEIFDEAFEGLKDNVRQKFSEAFAPVRNLIDNTIRPAFNSIKIAWENFSTAFSTFYAEHVQPTVDSMSEIFGILGDIISGVWDIFRMLALIIGDVISKIITSITESEAFKAILEELNSVAQKISNFFTNVLAKAIDTVTGFFVSLKDTILAALGAIRNLIETIKNELADALDSMGIPTDWLEKSPSPFEKSLIHAQKRMQELAKQTIPELSTSLSGMNTIPYGNAGGGGSTTIINNNQVSAEITNSQQSESQIADDLVFVSQFLTS